MLINMVLPGAVAAEEPFAFEYSGNFTDNRDADGKGTVRLNTSGTLTVLSGTATVSVYILGAGGGGAENTSGSVISASGGSGGYQTVEVELAPGTYEIVIGTGGAGTFYVSSIVLYGGEEGGTTTAFGYTSTGGSGGKPSGSNPTAGAGGTPNGNAGSTGRVAGGSPNGGASNGGSAAANSGGDGYVELTFI